MSLDPQFMRLLMETFQSELIDQLQQITDGLLALEKGLEPAAEKDALNGVFRSAHNLKGAARGVDATAVAELAHQLESLFSELRDGKFKVNAALIDLSLKALDGLRELADASTKGREAVLDQAGLVEKLKHAVAGGLSGAAAPAAPATAPVPAPPPASAVLPGRSIEHDVFETLAEQPPAPWPAPAAPAKPAKGASRPAAELNAEPIKVPAAKLQRVSALAEDLQMAKIAMGENFADTQALNQRLEKLESRMRILALALKRANSSAASHAGLAAEGRQALQEGIVDLADLRQRATALAKAMRGTLSRTTHLAGALQSDIRMMQLVPIATTLRPMARMVRDIGRELGKQVELYVTGDHIEVDRAVLEGIRDPLMHLMRNAIDHGLETPDQRKTAGKADDAAIWLDVSSAGGRIQVTVRDNGRGIDADQIGQIAIKKRLISVDELERMDKQARLELIFRPGFSSKEIITDLSGRGVGLDVVVANIRALNGTVKLETTAGQGTLFTLQLPLTLATERGLHIRAGGEHLVIPSTAVDRITEIEREQILEVAANHAMLVEGKPVALRDLAATLQMSVRTDLRSAKLPVVVVSKGWTVVAFLVDEVVGEREIVIKRLPPPLQTVPNISGATLTGNGEIMMVLNVADLIDRAHRQPGRADLGPLLRRDTGTAQPHILVVDDSVTTRTLEKNLLENHGYRVSVATDGQYAWEMLQRGQFNLVVTDVEMPRLNGFELAERIRRDAKLAELPVVVVTSLAKEGDKRRGIEVGADAYIVKGEFESRALLDVVRQLI